MTADGEDPAVTCDHCGKQVPDAVFCTNCGAHQGLATDGIAAQERTQHFAAHPGEHVSQPSIFSTLFPHLGHRKIHEFRWAFILGLAAIVVLVATGLIIAALLASIFLVPTLYILYLYEAQVYRDEPALVLGATLVGGIILGLIVTIIADRVIGVTLGSAPGPTFGYTVILPVIQLIVMPLPALLLRTRQKFNQTIDGLVFGITAGLGFGIAEGIVNYSNVIANLGVHTDSGSWIYPMVSLAVLVPLVHGSATGAVTSSLWRPTRAGTARWISRFGIPVALVAVLAFYAGGQVLTSHFAAPLIVLAYQAAIVLILIVYIRHLVHHALLEEGRDLGYRAIVCAHCHHHVMAAGFCPSCGSALGASPRRDTGAEPAPVPASTAEAT
jgi:RsiW-degrading membrane proteinase PrsW (M82 family)